jgi:hypothetical protein
MAKPKVFDPNNPLVISIHKHNGQWDIRALASNGHFQVMKDRLKENIGGGKKLRDEIDGFYVNRKKTGAPAHPPFKNPADPDPDNPSHSPILMREGETVRFECDPPYEFKIWCDRDDNVGPNLSAPSNPFGWTSAQPVAPMGTLTATVQMPAQDANGNPTGPGPKDQGFYKFSATIYEEEQGKAPTIARVDPDGYCDR